jgi:hypothetical protein
MGLVGQDGRRCKMRNSFGTGRHAKVAKASLDSLTRRTRGYDKVTY